MREIKFRAWDGRYDQWAYFDLSHLTGGEVANVADRAINWCQYTGIKDKNGVEIYEGDVIQVNVFASPLAVEYFEDVAMFGVKKDDHQYHLGVAHAETDRRWTLEVIGNIYENPELMEKSSGA